MPVIIGLVENNFQFFCCCCCRFEIDIKEHNYSNIHFDLLIHVEFISFADFDFTTKQ